MLTLKHGSLRTDSSSAVEGREDTTLGEVHDLSLLPYNHHVSNFVNTPKIKYH